MSRAGWRFAFMIIHIILTILLVGLSVIPLMMEADTVVPGLFATIFACFAGLGMIIYVPAALHLGLRQKATTYDKAWGEVFYLVYQVVLIFACGVASSIQITTACDESYNVCNFVFPIIVTTLAFTHLSWLGAWWILDGTIIHRAKREGAPRRWKTSMSVLARRGGIAVQMPLGRVPTLPPKDVPAQRPEIHHQATPTGIREDGG